MKIKFVKEILKACSNENCCAHAHKEKYEENVTHCRYCGGTLYHVCKHTGCYEPIKDPTATLCEKHAAEKHRKSRNKLDVIVDNTNTAKKAITGATEIAAAATPIIQGIKNIKKNRK